ncbi:MAG: endonuclease/exonuclease/phosphatase family protein [Bacteriovoracaceae bacterium]|nr:endonuclease/exonuclease/phosphatase family protein [Bacteriovoracaceae bacterium]
MKIYTILILLLVITSCSSPTIRVVHYNIKELSTPKIDKDTHQIRNVKKVLEGHSFDILSLNEIQFDQQGVPTLLQTSKGENLKKLATKFDLTDFNDVFHPANTGEKAKKKKDGSYFQNVGTSVARAHADQENFGVFPHQYSTGALLKYRIISEIVIKDLKWKDFNPKIDLSKFRMGNKKRIPKDISLFDKNFTDVVADVDGHEVHFIFLHTVPSYHFGNKKSPNYIRNADQLRFLEWYLTGSTDIDVNLSSIKPLSPKATYIAMGDFNTDIKNLKNPGSAVLRRLFEKSNTWIKQKDMTFTNEGSSYSPKPFRLLLDYIISSKNLEPVAGGIIHPNWNKRRELGCNGMPKLLPASDMALVSYRQNKKECWALVDKYYQTLKDASDHYPLWGHFKIK